MRFDWDEAKRQANIRRHGFDFLLVERVFEGHVLTRMDDRFEYGEIRLMTLGVLNGRVVAIAHTQTDEIIRIISVRKASKNEEESYYKEIAG